MCRIDQHQRVSALVLLAAFVSAPLTVNAQLKSGVAGSIPPSPRQPLVTETTPQFQASPEEIGDALMAHQRYQEAIEQYKKAPASPTVWNKMGVAYQLMFDLKDAERCYRESLRLQPRSANVLNNLGTVYDTSKDYKKAEHLYRKALKLDPKSALICKNLGTNLMTRHKYKQGWEVYKRAVALDPNVFAQRTNSTVANSATAQERGAMNYYMARGCVQAGLTDRAVEYLRMAMDEGYTNPRKIAVDTSFERLHGNPAFQQLLLEERSQ